MPMHWGRQGKTPSTPTLVAAAGTSDFGVRPKLTRGIGRGTFSL